jgi:hypothetical protein
MFFAYDEIVLHKMGIVIFQTIEKALVKSNFFQGIDLLRDITNSTNPKTILKILQSLRLSRRKMKEKMLAFKMELLSKENERKS